jgi:photosystem II stability/assembly factor-like uncharacterized protein
MKRNLFGLFILFFIVFAANSQWSEQTSGQTTALYSISAVDDNIAWIGGAGGKVLRTTNGGTTWTSVGGGAIGAADVYNIFAINDQTALCTTSPAATFVYRTSNAGATWTQVFTQTGGFMDAIWMTSATNGFMYGDPVGTRWSLWKTSNGGVNWDSTGLYQAQVSGEAGWNNAMYVSGTSIYFGTNAVRLYYSSNNGSNWITQTTPVLNQYAIWFNSSTSGLSGGTGINSTTNGGTNWTVLTAPGTGNVAGITGVGTNYWFVRQATGIYRTTNNGTSWTTEYTAPAGNFLHIAKARSGNRLWAVRQNGGISKSDGLVGINPVSIEIPSSFSLDQNYPNPFNPSTTFRFNVPSASQVSLKIYDMLGNEISTVVNENLQAGIYEVKFDASSISSGVYFYSLETNGFKETKKMLLVK